MKWHNLIPFLKALWHRPAGPMNWKNPILVLAVVGWLVVQGFVLLGWAGFRAGQFVAALPAPVILFFAGLWYAVWSFVRRPFPALDENPLLDLVNYHTPTFYSCVLLWYYVSPFVVVMLSGLIALTVWKVWLEGRRRDFAPFAKLPPWPLDPKQKAPAIVIGEVHHPVEAREIFSPSWLTIPERGLYTGVAIFGAVGSPPPCMAQLAIRDKALSVPPRSWRTPQLLSCAKSGAWPCAGGGFEAASQALGSGLQADRRSVERVLNHIRQIEQQRFGPERNFGPSR